MSTWRVRFEGSPTVVEVPSAAKVLEGLRDGEWEPTDEVRGPGDTGWFPIADHPQFADPVAEMEPVGGEHPDETRLDMNPLIDVALVLLIFFILTTTYSSLRRTIDVPAAPDSEAQAPKPPTPEELKDRVFTVVCWLEDDKPAIKIEDKLVEVKDLEKEVAAFVKTTGRREMLLEVDGRVPWGIEAQIHDAAKAADIHQIYRKPKKAGA
jgi:biopolymer transport protein ExbD